MVVGGEVGGGVGWDVLTIMGGRVEVYFPVGRMRNLQDTGG